MPKRRKLHEDSRDPDGPPAPPPLKRGKAALEGPPPLAPPPAGAGPHPGFGVGLNVPPTFFGSRALFILLKLGNPAQPVRLMFLAADGVPDERITRLFQPPLCRIERRAPGVFDAELPADRLEAMVREHPTLFRRIDAPDWLYGQVVPGAGDRCEVAIAVDEPATAERRRALAGLGFHMVGESEGEIRGAILGKNLAQLLMLGWIGPVDVRKVHPPKG